jgi:hypothetical protein
MSALRQTLAVPPLTPAELHFLRTVANDTEDAPWMTMSERQWRGASALFWSLEIYARAHRVAWYPGGMLPLTYRPPGARRRKQVAPDVFAARVPLEGRDSLAVEEDMPPFVLEVVSASSVKRDLQEKTELYRLLGAREYAIVRLDLAEPRLEGYRRAANGVWMVWTPEAERRLWSAVLGLGLVLRGGEARAVTRDGALLRTPREEAEARARAEAAQAQAEAAQAQAEAAQAQEALARARVEEEMARLRAELDQLRREGE